MVDPSEAPQAGKKTRDNRDAGKTGHDPLKPGADADAAKVPGRVATKPAEQAGAAGAADVVNAAEQLGQEGPAGDARSQMALSLRGSLMTMREHGGSPLGPDMARDFGSRLGADLSGVRVHDSSAAHAATSAVGALAFASGQDIALGGGFDMGSAMGKHILAHELVHTVQNQGAPSAPMSLQQYANVGPSSSPIESEAEAGASAITSGQKFSVQTRGATPTISRYVPVQGEPVRSPANVPAGPARPAALGDAGLGELMNRMADPAVAARYQQFVGSHDALRLQGMQFSYNSTSFYRSVTQAFVPFEAVKEHFGQMTGNTVYNNPRSGLERLQGWIEQYRGYIRLLGDIAAAVGTWMGLLGMIGDGLVALAAVFPPAEAIAVPIKKIVDVVGSIPWIIKALTDAIDVLLGVVQLVILYYRARNTTNPAERARIAQQMKKESGDLVAAISSLVMSAVTAVVSAAISASANTIMGSAGQLGRQIARTARTGRVTPGLRMAGGKWWKSFKTDLRAQTIAGGGNTTTAAIRTQVRMQVLSLRIRGRYQNSILRPVPTAALARIDEFKHGAIGNIRNFNVSTALGMGSTEVKAGGATDHTAGTAPKAPGAEAERMNITNQHVHMWPAQLAELQALQGTVAPAKVKVLEAYQSAKRDCDPALAARFEAQFGRITQNNGRLRSEAMHTRMTALQQQPAIQTAQGQSTQAGTQATTAQSAQQRVTTTGNTARTDATQLHPVPNAPERPPSSLIQRGVDWAYTNTIGHLLTPVNNWIGRFQAQCTAGLTRMMLRSFTKEELDTAGIDAELRNDNQKEVANAQQAQDTTTASAKIERDLAQLKQGESDTRQRAMNTMVDAMQLLEQLDQADAELTEMIADGVTSVAQIKEQLRAANATESAGRPIDAAYVQPLITGVEAAKQNLEGRSDSLAQQAHAQLDGMGGRLGNVQGTPLWTGARAAANERLTLIITRHRECATAGSTALAGFETQARAKIGSQDYASINTISAAAEASGNQTFRNLTTFETEAGSLLDLTWSEVSAAASAAAATAPPATTTAPATAAPNGAPPPADPAATPTPNAAAPDAGPTPTPPATVDPADAGTADPSGGGD